MKHTKKAFFPSYHQVQCLNPTELEELQRIFISLDQTKEGTIRYWELEDAIKKGLTHELELSPEAKASKAAERERNSKNGVELPVDSPQKDTMK